MVGYGLAGRYFHAPFLRAAPGFDVAAIVTANDDRRAQATADFPDATLLAGADDVWQRRDEFDLVVIATGTAMHARLATEAVDARLPVVVEKPLAATAADAAAVVERAAAADVLVVPYQNRRWDADVLTLRTLLDEGALGAVRRFDSRFERWQPAPNPSAWRQVLPSRAGGGVLLDLGIHLVDQALTLFGPARLVHSEIAARRGGADDDAFLALEHESGPISHLWASAVAAAPGPRLRVLGSRAGYLHEHLDPQEAQLRAGRSPADEGFGTLPQQHWGRLMHGEDHEVVDAERGRWAALYDGVERALRQGSPPPVDARDAVAALHVLDAARGLT